MSLTQSSQFLTSQNSIQKSQDIKTRIRMFKTTLEEIGIQLSFGDEPHVLTQEQSLVVRDLEKYLEQSNDVFESFMTGLKILCKKEKYFKKALALTYLRKRNNETIGASAGQRKKDEQESLFRIFLKVGCLQTEVTEVLLEEITSISCEATEDTSWLHSLLSSFRYLPYMKDPENITTKLIDILEVATYPAQLEILDTIPEIIPDSQFSETTKQLCKLLDEKDELTGAIIDCLNALDLDADMRTEVQDRVLERMSGGTSLKDFPILLSFLMSDCKSQNSVPVLLKIRNALDSIMLTPEKSKDKESSKILIFNKLQSFTISSKAASEAWLNMISSIKSSSDHKPIDYLIMFMLYNVAPFKKRIIEAIFRKRVHSGLFKINNLEKMFDKYLPQQLLKDYLTSIVEIGSHLARSSGDQIIKEFCLTLYKLLFNHEYTESIYRREILNNLIVLIGASDKKTVNTVLSIISTLADNKEKLQQHIMILMRLLEKLDSLDPTDVKVMFEILCGLTCGPDVDSSMSGAQNEIHIIIRKQLCGTKKSIKYRGIIAAVVMARSIARISSEDTRELPKTSMKSLSSLPRGPAREAGSLLELANTCSSGYPDLIGLYYDQLASMLISKYQLDKFFLAWLYETVTEEFRKIYISESLPQPINDLEMTFQYTLNRSTEVDSPMGINIGELTLKKNPAILVLAPRFRLLRLLHYRQQDGNLSTIDALLGSAVILPRFDDVDYFDSDQIKQVADCLFHSANWFRELISGFVTQKDKKLRMRVIQRLGNLLEVESNLSKCLAQSPNHKFPASYFDLHQEANKNVIVKSDTRAKNPKKKVKTSATVEADDTVNSTIATQSNKRKASTSNVSSSVEHKIHFRDLDTDAVLLLKYPLSLSDESSPTPSQAATLQLEELKFLLKDLVLKLTITTQSKNAGLSHLNEVIPLHIITDVGYVLPNLDLHLRVIVDKLNKLLEETDGRTDLAEMFSPTAINYKTCFGLILESLLLIFSWTGFQHYSNLEVLKNMLKSMRSTEQSQSLHSAHRLIIELINRLSGYHEQCLELSHAVYLLKTMEALYAITTPSPDIQKKISAVAEKLLSRRWYNSKGIPESGRNCYLNIDVLVKTYLSSADVETLTGLIGTLQEQIESLVSKEDYLQMLNSIDKPNFHVLYNGLCSALVNRTKTEIEHLSNNQHIILWTNVTLALLGLKNIAQKQETRTNLGCYLKKSIAVLKIFLSHGIPMMELMLKSKPDEVVTIFKTMQSSTRFLHHLCCYSKFTKDASLMAYVPQFRLTLESLVYRVKAALAANNCSSAFWMGHLKNKDLHGEEILSQSTVMTDDNDKGSDEELLPSDESDTEILNVNNEDDRSVSSEVYD
ncbi:Fanconi anemia group D2 protein isoform X3 [Diabrotica virgifera virgifera]|uniref:Fanconi anemia group D2 protein n=1 Tax=Diabrotica virgifera virgifera TaxID=50390 RepID=A0ABM5KJE8_DIAVI|nr:Fanconi anemia group D2 protein isoform X3 [Diabrotica virgifera virgifera]